MNLEKQNKSDDDIKKNKFTANNRYFTICIYTMFVIFFGAIIINLITSWNTTLKNIENKILKEVDCGLTAESGDFKTLAENVIAMYRKTEEERLQLGMNGQTYYKVHFQKKVCIDKLDQTMKI